MNIVILNGSPRKNGNTEIMVDTFLKGAEKSGNQVQKFNLGEMKVAPDTNSYVGWKDRGIITISGMTKKGDMSNHAKLEEVYHFGESLK